MMQLRLTTGAQRVNRKQKNDNETFSYGVK